MAHKIVSIKEKNGTIIQVKTSDHYVLTIGDVIKKIKSGEEFIVDVDGKPVKVRPTLDSNHITTNADGSKCNNLDGLPKF